MPICTCPHCGVTVSLLPNDICPACRQNANEAPVAKVPEEPPTAGNWDDFYNQHQSTPKTSTAGQEADGRFSALLSEGLLLLRSEAPATATVDFVAQQIETEVVPALSASLDDSQGDPQSADRIQSRIEAWQSLSQALRDGDAKSRERCELLWDAVGVEAITPAKQSSREATSPRVLHQFQLALAEFTPRLIATPTIIAVNFAVFATMVISGVSFIGPDPEQMIQWGANFGPLTMNGQWWRTVTCMFLHFGIIHIAFNMWVLWALGQLVERLVGNVGFLVLYFSSGIAGSLASLAWNAEVVSAGASGAVFGVAGALLGLLAFNRNSIPTSILKSLRTSLLTFLAYNFLFGAAAPGIDMAAHLGGFIAGFFGGLLLSQPVSAEAVKRRPLRNAALAVASACAVLAAANALPPGPANLREEVDRFVQVEEDAIQLNNTLIELLNTGQLTDGEFAQRIEQEILPPWAASRKRLSSLSDSPQTDPNVFPKLLAYMQSREESWQARIQSLRSQDAELAKKADEKWRAAEEAAQALNSP